MKVATVCTGVGAPEQAIKELGWDHEIVFGCEIDKYARTTYQANFNPHTMYTDMTAESWDGDHYYADLFVGGIPCQSFSLAGKRLGELDPRGLLFYNFYEYVKKQQPKVFIIENVKGLLSDNKGKTFQNWIQLLARSVNTQEISFPHPDSLRYNLHYTVLNAKDFGLPQNRERVFIVGIREDFPNSFRFPVGWPLEIRLKDVLESEVDEKYYLSDKMLNYLNTRKDNFNGGKINYKTGNDVASCINASSKSLDISDNIIVEGEVTPNSQAGKVYSENGIMPTVTAGTHGYALGYVNQSKVMVEELVLVGGIKDGQYHEGVRTEDYPQAFRVYSEEGLSSSLSACGSGMGGKTGLYFVGAVQDGKFDNSKNSREYPQGSRVYHEEGISQTITAQGAGIGGNSGAYQVRNRIRRLTPRECFRLQGFPDSFDISQVSDTQAYKQAGNSIPTTVLMEIMRNLKPILKSV